MPLNKPIPDSVIRYWQNVFKELKAKFNSSKK